MNTLLGGTSNLAHQRHVFLSVVCCLSSRLLITIAKTAMKIWCRITQVRLFSVVHGLDITLPLLSSQPILTKQKKEEEVIAASPADATTDGKQPSPEMPPPGAARDVTDESEVQQQAAALSSAGAERANEKSAGELSTAKGAVVQGAEVPAMSEEMGAGAGGGSDHVDESSRSDGGREERVVPVSAQSFFFVCPPLSALVSRLVSYQHDFLLLAGTRVSVT